MNTGTDDRLSTEQYTEVYRRLPHNSSVRRQIEDLLDAVDNGQGESSSNDVRAGSQYQTPTPQTGGDFHEFDDLTLSTAHESESEPSVNGNALRRSDSFHGLTPFPSSIFGGGSILSNITKQFAEMNKRMDEQFNRMRRELSNESGDDSDEGNNYSFSKRTKSRTIVGKDGKKYTTTDVQTDKYKDGSRNRSRKRVYRRGDSEVQFIKHNDGREQIVGDRNLVKEFPEYMHHKGYNSNELLRNNTI